MPDTMAGGLKKTGWVLHSTYYFVCGNWVARERGLPRKCKNLPIRSGLHLSTSPSSAASRKKAHGNSLRRLIRRISMLLRAVLNRRAIQSLRPSANFAQVHAEHLPRVRALHSSHTLLKKKDKAAPEAELAKTDQQTGDEPPKNVAVDVDGEPLPPELVLGGRRFEESTLYVNTKDLPECWADIKGKPWLHPHYPSNKSVLPVQEDHVPRTSLLWVLAVLVYILL